MSCVAARYKPSNIQLAGVLTLTAVTASFASEYGLLILQGRGRFGLFNRLRVFAPFLYAIVAVLLVTLVTNDLEWLAGVTSAAALVAGSLTLRVALRSPSPEAQEGVIEFREVARFGGRSYLGYTSPIESFRIDQVLVALVFAPAVLGVYVVGTAFANLPRFISQSIGFIASPTIALEERSSTQWARIWQFFAFTFAITSGVAAILAIGAGRLVPLLFGTEFNGAVMVSRLLVINGMILGLRRVLADAMRGFGRPGLGAISEIVALAAVVPLAAILVPSWGIEGVATAMAVSSSLALGALIILSLRAHRTGTGFHPPGNTPQDRLVVAK